MKNTNTHKLLSFSIAWIMFLAFFLMPLHTKSVSAQEEPSMIVEIGTVEISREQLIADHYLVTLPISFVKNPGFTTIQMGVAVIPEQITALGARKTDVVSPMFGFSDAKDFIWITAMNALYDGSNFCSITFQVNQNIEDGAYIPIQGEPADMVGLGESSYTDETLVSHPLEIISGAIKIVDHVVPEVKLEIGTVTIEQGALEENDYVVEVPISATENNGFFGMRFGLQWDAASLSPLSPSGNTPEGLSILPAFSQDGNGWVEVYATDTYNKSNLMTLRFQVPENARPGNFFKIEGSFTSPSGRSAMVINDEGTEGTLQIVSGGIRIKSTQGVNSNAVGAISLPKLNVSVEELQANDYQIQYPVYISKNSAFTELEFGMSWDSSQLTMDRCNCDDPKNLDMDSSLNFTGDALWTTFLYQGKGAAYVAVPLYTVTFRVSPDVKEGDIITLTADKESYTGAVAEIINIKGESGILNLVSGSISIVSDSAQKAEIAAKAENIAIEYDELKFTDNVVSIPLLLTQNQGFYSLSFGISWDPTLAEPEEVFTADQGTLGLQIDYSPNQDMVWLTFISIDPYSSYIYHDLALGTLKLRLSDEIKAGDLVKLHMETVSRNGSVAGALNAENTPTIPLLTDGSVTITGEIVTTEVPPTTTDTTEETTESTTTATTTASTAVITTDSTESATEESTVTSTTITSSEEISTEITTTTATSASTTMSTETTASTMTEETTTTFAEPHLSHNTLTMQEGKTRSLTFFPGTGKGTTCFWVSRDPQTAAITSNSDKKTIQLTAKKPGITLIYAVCGDEVFTCEITVLAAADAPTPTGDINMDGDTDISDVVLMMHYLNGTYMVSENAQDNMDLNQDGVLDCADALLLLQKLSKTV